MKIDRTYLQTMFREFWALNNELCENATIIFLRKHDFSDSEIEEFLEIKIKDRNLKEAEELLSEVVRDTINYY